MSHKNAQYLNTYRSIYINWIAQSVQCPPILVIDFFLNEGRKFGKFGP